MLKTHQRILVAILLASVSCWPCAAQIDAAPLRFAGCYALDLGRWSPPLGRDSIFYAVPRRIVLDTAPTDRGRGWRVSPNIRYPNARVFPGTPRWEVRADTVVLTWSNGFTPTIVKLLPRGTLLAGDAVALTDVHFTGEPPRPRAPVTIRRQECGTG
jgi:hypothetical protein